MRYCIRPVNATYCTLTKLTFCDDNASKIDVAKENFMMDRELCRLSMIRYPTVSLWKL